MTIIDSAAECDFTQSCATNTENYEMSPSILAFWTVNASLNRPALQTVNTNLSMPTFQTMNVSLSRSAWQMKNVILRRPAFWHLRQCLSLQTWGSQRLCPSIERSPNSIWCLRLVFSPRPAFLLKCARPVFSCARPMFLLNSARLTFANVSRVSRTNHEACWIKQGQRFLYQSSSSHPAQRLRHGVVAQVCSDLHTTTTKFFSNASQTWTKNFGSSALNGQSLSFFYNGSKWVSFTMLPWIAYYRCAIYIPL